MEESKIYALRDTKEGLVEINPNTMRPVGRDYQHGDIGAVDSNSLLAKAQRAIFLPKARAIHHFLIADYIPEEDDYVILESIAKGIAVGRLSMYQPETYRVYRPVLPDSRILGIRACRELTRYGRARYDYGIYFKMAIDLLFCFARQLVLERKMHKIRAKDLLYGRDSRFICTEAVNEAWRAVGYPIIPKGVIPIPPAFIEAHVLGKIEEVTEGINYEL